jgi:hypothetical protein
MTSTAEIEQLQAEMARIRRDLNGNVDEIVESAKELTDWRLFVRSYPWASVGAAVAAGYLVAPRIFRSANHEDGEADRPQSAKSSAIGSAAKHANPLVHLATSALMRNVAQLATQYVTNRLVSPSTTSASRQPPTLQGVEYGH